jgi:CRP-like cAMP-binding protein
VKLSVVSGSGKEAVVAMFGPGDFFGEGCMARPTLRMGSTTAATPSTLLAIQKRELLRVLHAEHELSTISPPTCSRTTFALRKT